MLIRSLVFRPHQNQNSDAQALQQARLAAQGIQVSEHHRKPRGDRRETATDEQASSSVLSAFLPASKRFTTGYGKVQEEDAQVTVAGRML